MNELEQFYGVVGMGLITLALPYLFQMWKLVTEWEGRKMFVSSIVGTYLLVDLYHLATFLLSVPDPSPGQILILILGLILYPLLVWAGTQGLYSKTMTSKVA